MTTNAAIPKDVEVEVEDGTPKERGTVDLALDPQVPIESEVEVGRDTIMDRIHERRKKEIEAEISLDNPEATLDPNPEPTQDPIVDPELPPDPVETPEKTVIIKVDGVETAVTEAEIREYQKNQAADLRLEEANRRAKELEAREADLAKRLATLESSKKKEDRTNLANLSQQLISGVYDEDSDKVAEILAEFKELASAEQLAAPSASDIEAAVERTMLERERKAAITRFASEYPALDKNVGLRGAVDARTVVELEKDPEAPVWDIIDRAAKHVTEETAAALGLVASKEGDITKQGSASKADRIEAKRSAGPAIRATVSSKASLAQTTPKKLTDFQMIQKARGQL